MTTLAVVESDPEPRTETIGDVVGNYRLEQLIGEGAMGTVYLGRHTRLDRAVALKVLHPKHTREKVLVQRFLQEARTVNQINHHHIIEVHDFVEELEPARVYYVMELLTGQTLAQRLAAGGLTLREGVGLLRQIAEALGAAHRAGVVHRDLKPENLFLANRDGRPDFVKVLDFGVAKLVANLGRAEGLDTLSGSVVGTPRYMAPEQAAGLEVDQRADIYALGTILYELLAGRTPFTSPTFGQLTAEIITKPPPPLPRTTPAGERVPAELERLALACLAKNADERPASMGDVIAWLDRAGVDGPSLAEGPTRRTLPLLALGAAGVVLMAGVVLATLTDTPAPVPLPPPPAPVVALPAPPPVVVEAPKPPPDISLSVGTVPSGASITRADTQAVLGRTPAELSLPRQDGELTLFIELAGYKRMEKKVRLDTNGSLELTLVPEPKKKKPQAVQQDGVLDPFGE